MRGAGEACFGLGGGEGEGEGLLLRWWGKGGWGGGLWIGLGWCGARAVLPGRWERRGGL